jgi:hypothetical protein
MKYFINPLVLLYFIITLPHGIHPAAARELNDWEEPDAVLVGRISHVEGHLSRFDPETERWVSTTREAPFGTDDLLRTDPDARAEIILPNNTWARIDGDTQIELSALAPRITEVDLTLGIGRFYNKSTVAEISATTPFGRITAPPGAAFDLYVSEVGVDIVAVQNSVFFSHNASSRRHEVRSDSSALFADMQEITAVASAGDPEWGAWNKSMDGLWTERMASRGESATYLPPELHTEAHALDKHGHWERVYYQGRYYRFWRPVHVSVSWSPFAWGAWVVWHGDHVWIPHEPFGYVTHHYGNWIFTAGHWYWTPPVTSVMVRARLPLLHIGFGWYPGRVSWIHSGAHVGWIPLAPHEPYYTHRHWGRRSIAAARWKGRIHRRHVYKHHHHAVVVHRSHLYRTNDYRRARVRGISHHTIRNKFRSAHLPDLKRLRDDRRREKHDRFHRNDGRRKTGPTRKIRPRSDQRRYARHSGEKRRSHPDNGRGRVKNVSPSTDDRNVRKSHVRRAKHQAGTETKRNRRPEKMRRHRTAQRLHKEDRPGDTRRDRGAGRYTEKAGNREHLLVKDKRARKRTELTPSRSRRLGDDHHRTGARRMTQAPQKERTDRRHTISTGAAERHRQKHHMRNGRPMERSRAMPRSHERQRAKKEMKPRRSKLQVPRREANRSVRKKPANRPNRGTVSRQRGRERATVRPPIVHRQPPQAARSPVVKRSKERDTTIHQRRQRQSGRNWRPSPSRSGNHQGASGGFRNRSGRHQRRNAP